MSKVAREGKRFRTEHLEIRVAASLLNHPRVGLIVPKLKHTIVERNRLKRRLREIVRTRLLADLPAIDMVVRARAEAYDASFGTLAAELALGAAKLPALIGR
ncbi:MAG: ribonuclease P protein component [Gemmatimonadota bacterium]|nr:ribonuclease P protein component [Gemmatimonadota bacterium]